MPLRLEMDVEVHVTDNLFRFGNERFLRVPLGIACDIRKAWYLEMRIRDD